MASELVPDHRQETSVRTVVKQVGTKAGVYTTEEANLENISYIQELRNEL